MYICVYAIAKNEEKFVKRWYDSVKEADDVFVLDTGSTDNTIEILSALGAKVTKKEIIPWRFDTARNESLALVPENADICVCCDLDEVFRKGWRNELEKIWNDKTTRISYRYTWSFDEQGNEGVVFNIDKIHSRKNYSWVNPVHEVLVSKQAENTVFCDKIQLNHFPDKNKSRGQYLDLLELSVRENPNNDRNVHYLGREYMYYSRFNDAIGMLKRHLSLNSATWKDERCASLRYIARCYSLIGDNENSLIYHIKSVAEAPYLREPWVETGIFLYSLNDWCGTVYFLENALKIKERKATYITEPYAWNALPYDLLSIAYYNLNNLKSAISNAKEAVKLSNEQRLRSNLTLFEEKI